MESGNTQVRKSTNRSGFNLGKYGWIIVILTFLSMFLYTSLGGDSLNVTIGVFASKGLDSNVMYLMSTFGTILGVITTIVFSKIITVKRIKNCWGILMLVGGVSAIVWAFIQTTFMYCVVYLVCFASLITASQFLTLSLMANWFPKTRGIAMGLVTIGFPLSAATTTSICTGFIQSKIGISGYYILMGVIALIIGVLVLSILQDHPEDKGCYPDNNREFDFEQVKKEHEMNLEYQKTSKWTVGKVLKTGRFWVAVLSLVIAAFVCQGVMANFVNKFMESGYGLAEILGMLTIAGLSAIPLSVFVGWLDLKIGTKKTGIIVNSFMVAGLIMLILPVHALNYVALPIMAVLLGGSNNLTMAVFEAIWGRYDFQNVYRVYSPISSLALGLGITVVGLIGTNASYKVAYIVLLALAVISLICMIFLKVEPIDEDVHMS